MYKSIMIISFLFLGCVATEPFYIFTQGYYQVKYLLSRRKISLILRDPTIPEHIKKKLRLVMKIKEFAKKELYLKSDDQYIYYLKIPQKAISFIVVASKPYDLEPKTYWFPVVGTVPYIGFFQKKEAIQYAQYLRQSNWDVRISPVQAYSTLGWFSDPILSSFLELSEMELAGLIFHELTHATYWKTRDSIFNETLASFVEKKGVMLYVKKYNTDSSKKIQVYQQILKEKKELQKILFSIKKKLIRFYNQKSSWKEKLEGKKKIFISLKQELIAKKSSFKILKLDPYINRNYNNADFVLLNLYENPSYEISFETIFRNCNKKFRCFWKVLKNSSR